MLWALTELSPSCSCLSSLLLGMGSTRILGWQGCSHEEMGVAWAWALLQGRGPFQGQGFPLPLSACPFTSPCSMSLLPCRQSVALSSCCFHQESWDNPGTILGHAEHVSPALCLSQSPPPQLLCSSCCRRREQESSQAAWLAQAESYENKHLGGFRRIYPAPGTEKYEPFFQQSRSLFQETASSKAREEYARYTAPVETHFSQVAWRPLAPDPSWGAALLFGRCKNAGRVGGEGKEPARAVAPQQRGAFQMDSREARALTFGPQR